MTIDSTFDAKQVLGDKQASIVSKVLHEERNARTHLVVSLSGAHAYGFESPDSDVDLKAIHIEPTSHFIGLLQPQAVRDRLEVIDGVEIDYTSNEISGVLLGVLNGNGNYLERILGHLQLDRHQALPSLIALMPQVLSKRLYQHYRGFATSQRKAFDAAPKKVAKKVLYVLRTTLTGTHVLRSKVIEPNLANLYMEYGFPDVRELIELKRAGEKSELSASQANHWTAEMDRAFALLDDAINRSQLPDTSQAFNELHQWLVEVRSSHFH